MTTSSYQILSPKRDASARKGWRGFFPYYAGFSERFAAEMIASARLPKEALIWDPWNGSGTATYAGSALGYNCTGYDINPVMVIVARARLLPPSEADSLLPIAQEIARVASKSRATVRPGDPLLAWFDVATASLIRNFDRAIRRHLVGPLTRPVSGPTDLSKLSGVAAAMYVSVFSLCRAELASVRTSNPTWYRAYSREEKGIRVDRSKFTHGFISLVTAMQDALVRKEILRLSGDVGKVDLYLQDTANTLPLEQKADFVLTSPPYCTRIDYAASTRIELAVIGPWLKVEYENLSSSMIGTIKVPKRKPAPRRSWGSQCISFLRQVRDHSSKASKSYYLKNHMDYFDKIERSLDMLSSSVKRGGIVALVAQDSFYKEIHNPLPDIFVEMGLCKGLRLFDRRDFSAPRSMSGINKGVRLYREHRRPTESVLLFERE